MKIHLIAGARPNFMKIAPILRAAEETKGKVECKIVHTGQHYDRVMSQVFFEELGIREPDYNLGCGGGSHAEQTSKVMLAYEKLCAEDRPDLVMVVGDVNSTLACALVAKKLQIPVAHVEAGLRSGDRNMPEEINRLAIDAITDLFFVTEPSGEEHLLREGQPREKIYHVGHVMVDNLLYQRDKLFENPLTEGSSVSFKQKNNRYGVVTLHRPSNVDDEAVFKDLAGALRKISEKLPLVFPVHPRTRANMEKFGIDLGDQVTLLTPLGYMEFLNLWKDAVVVLTDSGGIQEETTALGVPCLTLRENTERPITIDEGSNILVGVDPEKVMQEADKIISGKTKAGRRPELWDGKASERIISVVLQ